MKSFLETENEMLLEVDLGDAALIIDELTDEEEPSSTAKKTVPTETEDAAIVEEPDFITSAISTVGEGIKDYAMWGVSIWAGKKVLGKVFGGGINSRLLTLAEKSIESSDIKAMKVGMWRKLLMSSGVQGAPTLTKPAVAMEFAKMSWRGAALLASRIGGAAIANPWATLGITIAIGGIFAWFKLVGDKAKKEILEIWSRGVYTPILITTSPFVQEIVKLIGSSLTISERISWQSSDILCKKYGQSESLTALRILPVKSRLENEVTNEKMAEFVAELDSSLSASKTLQFLINDTDSKTWKDYIDKINESYSGLNISSTKTSTDYNAIRGYVTKYKLEDEEKYGFAVAEEADGWYSTGFDAFEPGMLAMGWADWLFSKEFINNTNSYSKITEDRRLLYYAAEMMWGIKGIGTEPFVVSIEEFCKVIEKLVVGKPGPWSDVDFIKNMEFGVVSDDGSYKKINNFQAFLNESVAEHLKALEKSLLGYDKKFPYTSATVAISLYFLFQRILEQIEYNFVLHFTRIKNLTDVDPKEILKIAEESGNESLIDSVKKWMNKANTVAKSNNGEVGVEAEKPVLAQSVQAEATIKRVKELIAQSGKKFKG